MRCKQERAIYYQQKILETLLPIPHSPFPIPKKRQPFGHISNKTAITFMLFIEIERPNALPLQIDFFFCSTITKLLNKCHQ